MEELYIGTDIHRDYGVACVQDSKGKIVDGFRFGNDIEGINKVKEKLETFNLGIYLIRKRNL
jgi:hypothetical protein